MKKLIVSTVREGYGIDQVRDTMTVGELISLLGDYDEDTPIYLSFDNGYTYGGITEGRIEEDDNNGEIKVKFYKTVLGKDQLKTTRYFDSLEEAEKFVDEWESRTPDNYAIYC